MKRSLNLSNILFFFFCGLLVFILSCQIGIFPIRFIFFRSGSMRPTYQPGDIAVVLIGKGLVITPGEVVLFAAPIGPTIHRVVAIENGMITTQGDANNFADSNKIKHVDGKVLFSIPKLGYAIDFIQTTFKSFAQIFIKPQT